MGRKAGIINFYPTLDNTINLKDLNFNIDYKFSFLLNGRDEIIPLVENGSVIALDTSDSLWNSDDYDLNIDIDISFSNVSMLFGENGIAPESSVIGVCLEWYSSESKGRNVLKAHESISSFDTDAMISFSEKLPKKSILGTVNMNVLLYLKECDKKSIATNERHLCDKKGYILGSLDERKIQIGGDGSLFPIRIEKLDSHRLWDLQISYGNPEETLLVDGIVLVFNSSHPNYDMVNPNSSKYCNALVDEIVTNALTMLLCRLKEDGYLDDISEGYANGSIMEYAAYCKKAMKIDLSDSNSICRSFREYSEERNENGI